MSTQSPELEIRGQELRLGGLQSAVDQALKRLKEQRFSQRLWEKDSKLWKDDAAHAAIIQNSLGWLRVAEWSQQNLGAMNAFADSVRKDGFTHAVVLGMGGSSLAPEVLRECLNSRRGSPRLLVLDSTDPGWVFQIERNIELKKTLFIVASKSGTTTEPLSFYQYFFKLTGEQGRQFVAITDPGSYLEDVAREKGFRKIFLNPSDIGGRFSALSYFGLVPAAIAGMDVNGLINSARKMMTACGPEVDPRENPAAVLGAVLAEAARAGRDKVTLMFPKELETLGLWIEQLVAESSGKEGKGIVPIAGESPTSPEQYGDDRLFVFMRYKKGSEDEDRQIEALERSHPVVRITIDQDSDLGGEFFRWEVATAAACSLLEVDAFDQPDVQAAKDRTKELLTELKTHGGLPQFPASYQERNLKVRYSQEAQTLVRDGERGIQNLLSSLNKGDYVGLLAYTPYQPDLDKTLQEIRNFFRARTRAATLFGYGPRYLHSTGQLHKGGGNNGLFFIFTVDAERDMPVPEQGYTFGQLEMAQAIGDFQALDSRGRRAIWIHLKQPLVHSLKDAIRLFQNGW